MKKKLNLEIGERIRKRREEFGYSREEFSEMIGISSRFLSDVELGIKGTSLENLLRICVLLDASTDYILTGKESDFPDNSVFEIVKNIDPKYLPPLKDMLIAFSKATHID